MNVESLTAIIQQRFILGAFDMAIDSTVRIGDDILRFTLAANPNKILCNPNKILCRDTVLMPCRA